MPELIRCLPEHIEPLAQVLARAFQNDPLYEYAFPDPEIRASLSCWDLLGLLRYGLCFGEVLAPVSLSGCAVWLPPGETDFTEARMAEAGLLTLGGHIGAEADERLTRFNDLTEAVHRRILPCPHWYLLLLGVDPACQGQGMGSALISPKLASADRTRHSIYLETTGIRNLAFYGKHGFETVFQERLGADGPTIWYMVRPPHS